MSWRSALAVRASRWVLKELGDRMTAEQLVQQVFGPAQTGVRLGSAQLLDAYSTMPWLRATVSRISWAVATPPWKLYVATNESPDTAAKFSRLPKGVLRRDIARCGDMRLRLKMYKSLEATNQLREITTHPLLEVLDHGNPRFNGHVVRQVTQQHLDLVGEGVWMTDLNGFGLPTDLYPIPPTWVAMTPWDTGNNGMWQIHTPRGSVTLPPEAVIYFYHPNPADPYTRGRGIGHALGDELETDEAAAKHLKRWFKNFAIPPAIIYRKGGTNGAPSTTDNKERLEEAWVRKLGGRNNVPYFSNVEIGVQRMDSTFSDMQLSELRKDERDIFIHVYGLPPEVFGILENSNRSTIDAADYMLGRNVTVPRLEFMRLALQEQLVERYDPRLILDYVSPIAEDKDFQLRAATATPYVFTVDELRELGGRPPIEDGTGKGHLVPPTSLYVSSLKDAGISDVPAPVPPSPPAPQV